MYKAFLFVIQMGCIVLAMLLIMKLSAMAVSSLRGDEYECIDGKAYRVIKQNYTTITYPIDNSMCY